MHMVSSNAFSGDLLTPQFFTKTGGSILPLKAATEWSKLRKAGELLDDYLLSAWKVWLVEHNLASLTHSLGPAIIKSYANSFRRIDLTKELLGKLPPTSAQLFKCHRDVQDVIAFQSAGFRTSVQFNYEFTRNLLMCSGKSS